VADLSGTVWAVARPDGSLGGRTGGRRSVINPRAAQRLLPPAFREGRQSRLRASPHCLASGCDLRGSRRSASASMTLPTGDAANSRCGRRYSERVARFANGEKMSRLSPVIGARCANHRPRLCARRRWLRDRSRSRLPGDGAANVDRDIRPNFRHSNYLRPGISYVGH
jgi:hypothetical protein